MESAAVFTDVTFPASYLIKNVLVMSQYRSPCGGPGWRTYRGRGQGTSPAITPIKNASTYGGMSFLLHQQGIAATFD